MLSVALYSPLHVANAQDSAGTQTVLNSRMDGLSEGLVVDSPSRGQSSLRLGCRFRWSENLPRWRSTPQCLTRGEVSGVVLGEGREFSVYSHQAGCR